MRTGSPAPCSRDGKGGMEGRRRWRCLGPPRPAVGEPWQGCHHPNSQPHGRALPHCLHQPGSSTARELLCWSISPGNTAWIRPIPNIPPGGGDRDSSQWCLGTVTAGDGRAFQYSWERNFTAPSQAWGSFIPLSLREQAGRREASFTP